MSKYKPMPNKLTDEQIIHFWSRVDTKTTNECWDWIGCLNRDRGYGVIKIQQIVYYTHRIAYFLSYKKDPKELLVCHTCDNPSCCNPKHLWLGTMTDDIRDMLTKDRGNKVKGIKHHNAKLTEAQVQQIRKQYASGMSLRALAEQYGVIHSTIHRIVTKKLWKHV